MECIFWPLGGGSDKGIRRWRLADGQEVGKRVEMDVIDISVSRNHKRVVFGTSTRDVSVWDAGLRENLVIDVQGKNWVQVAVDVSPVCHRECKRARGSAGEHLEHLEWGETRWPAVMSVIYWVTVIRFSP